ncbi:hypothetical protein J6590_023569 [Homalodisca vitripennis]|nr:hypothetical protein J6590_023569 [Homalodisca vitripennis]
MTYRVASISASISFLIKFWLLRNSLSLFKLQFSAKRMFLASAARDNDVSKSVSSPFSCSSTLDVILSSLNLEPVGSAVLVFNICHSLFFGSDMVGVGACFTFHRPFSSLLN